jgi:hypothetical protein
VLLADCWVLGLSIVLLWPQRLAGYGLGHDMVFTPRQPLTRQSFGLGSVAPRAVPLDALVALASRLVDGAVLGRIALLVPLLLAGCGCVRLLRSAAHPLSLPGSLLVAGFAVWNPFVVERLALGQWALLWAYGALPWVVRAAGRLRSSPPDGWLGPAAVLLCWLACCAITPTGALIGAGVAVVIAWSRQLRRCLPVLVAALLVQLPWLVPALSSPAGATSDPRAVAAFAARSERPGGAWASLLGLGGIWNADVTPASRAGLLGYLSTAAVLAALVFGLPALRSVLGATLWRRLVLLGLAGLLLAVAGTVPGLAAVLRWAVRELPGAGLLRDGQKWLMPFVLLAVLSAGAAVQRGTGLVAGPVPRWPAGGPTRISGDRLYVRNRYASATRAVLALAVLALPLVLLPDAPATLRAPLSPVRYPAEWRQVAERLRAPDGAVLVLPFGSYRSFGWAPGRTVLDPAPRWLPAETVVDDRLVVSGAVLGGEDPAARRVAALLESRPGPAALATGLAGQGIGWVVRETGTPGPAEPELSGLQPVLTGGAVELYRVPGQVAPAADQAGRRWWVLGFDALVAALILAAAGVAIACNVRSVRQRLLHSPVTSNSEGS